MSEGRSLHCAGFVSYPVCQECGKRMRIVRRGPRCDEQGYYEYQIYRCSSCDRRVEQGVKTDGTPRERPVHESRAEGPREANR